MGDFDVKFEAAPQPLHGTVSRKPSDRSGACCVKRDHLHIYFGGLSNDDGLMNDLHFYDTLTGIWSEPVVDGLAPTAAFGVEGTLLSDGTILYFGGQCNQPEPAKLFSVLDVEASTWRPQQVTQDLLRGKVGRLWRWGHSLIVVPPQLHSFVLRRNMFAVTDVVLAIMGDDESGPQKDMIAFWRQSTDANLWHAFLLDAVANQTLLGRRKQFCALYRSNYIVTFGGRHSPSEFLNDLWIYSISAAVWVRVGPHMPLDLLHVFLDEKVPRWDDPRKDAVIVRQHRIAEVLAKAQANKSDSNVAWPSSRTGHVGLLQSDKLWIATGFHLSIHHRPVLLNDVWVFDLSSGKWTEVRKTAAIDQTWDAFEGFRPMSMTTLARIEGGSCCYFGGRALDEAVGDFGVAHFVQPRGPSLVALTRRALLLMASLSKEEREVISRLNASLPGHLHLHPTFR